MKTVVEKLSLAKPYQLKMTARILHSNGCKFTSPGAAFHFVNHLANDSHFTFEALQHVVCCLLGAEQAGSVYVPEREIEEEVADSINPDRGKSFGAFRAYALEILQVAGLDSRYSGNNKLIIAM